MTILSVCNSVPSRYIPAGRRRLAQLIITLLLTVQLVFVVQPLQANALSANSIQEPKDLRQLELGKPVERQLAGGESHFYQVALVSDQYLDLVVEQKGIDVIVILTAPDGKRISETDSPNGTSGPESIRAIIETEGRYQLEIRSLEKEAKAGRYEVKIVDLRVATDKDRNWVEAIRLHVESENLSRQRRYDDALPLAERAVTIIEKAFGPEDRRMAPAISSLAALYQNKQDYAKVEVLDLRVLAIMEKTLGPEHPNVAIALTNLGRLNLMRDDLDRAEQFFQRALSIREKVLGPEHYQVAFSTGDLATLFYQKDDHAKAEAFYLRTLAILEKTLGLEHPHPAEVMGSLASFYRVRGEYSKAESLYQRALSIFKKSYGEEHPDVALSYNNLAALYGSEGDYAKAEALHQRALEIFEKTLGPDHIRVSLSLTNLAPHYERRGEIAKAEQFYQRAISIGEKRFGPNHPDAAVPMTRLANLYKSNGDNKKSETLLQHVLEIVESKYGSDHPSVASAFGNLAQLYLDQGNAKKAIPLLSRRFDIIEKNLGRNILVGSERQKSVYLSTFNSIINDAISAHIRHAPDDAQALQLAFKTILMTKGRSLDAMSDAFALLRRHANAQDQNLLDELSKTLSQLATLTLRGPLNSPISVFREKLDQLKEQAEKLEAEISARNTELYSQVKPISLSKLQSQIPQNTALVEFASYTPFDLKTKKPLSQHYVAYALSSQGDPHWVELGEVPVINRAVEAWRKLLGSQSNSQAKVKQKARELDEVIMRPIRKLVKNTRCFLLSPDGELNLIPFGALVDENGRYLTEKYLLSYLTSGRDLVRLQVARESKNSPLILADPVYGESLAEKTTGGQPGISSSEIPLYFTPTLTANEAEAIGRMAPEAKLLMKRDATETALKHANAPHFLHIATHGFFLKDAEPAPENSRSFSLLGIGSTVSDPPISVWAARIGNPLLRSGLALAGANQRKSGNDDGVLTALEAAGLNLWGTKLVVLSACDTGVGEVKNGEGVYGLRRALVLAGSESQVMSLWKVRDDATRDLMIDYYTELIKRKAGRGEALRQVQLRMLRNPKRRHPYFWAGFIQSGEWANLDGQR